MSSNSKKRITHIGKNEESPPMCDDIVSDIIKVMDSNNYGKKINFMSSKQLESVNKTNSLIPVGGQNKYSSKQTKYLLEKRHPLMEKTQKSLKYLKHNRKIPKQRAHVSAADELWNLKKKSAVEFNKFEKDTKLMPQSRAIKKQGPVNNTNMTFSSNKKNKVEGNLNTPELTHKRNSFKKGTSVTSDSNELNYNNNLSSSDLEAEYEHFIRKHKVVSTDESDVGFDKSKSRQKKKFKRIQTYSDSEPDCGNINKVHEEISHEKDKNVKKRKKKVKKNSKKKLKLNSDDKHSHATKKMLNTDKAKDYSNKQNKSTLVPNEPSKMHFDGIENLENLKPTTELKGNYSALKKMDFPKFDNDFTLNLNEPGALNYISKHFGCFVSLIRNPYLDEEALSDVLLENKSEHNNSKNNENNPNNNLQHMLSKNEEIEVECLILESNLDKEISVNNISNLHNNKESDDDECQILENNLDPVNNSKLISNNLLSNASSIEETDDCLILCEVPKLPQNSSETCISDMKTGHEKLDIYPEVCNRHTDDNDLEINIEILSVKSLGDDKSLYSTSNDMIDNTLLNKNEQLNYTNNVKHCNSDNMFKSQSEQFKISTLNSKSFSKSNKDYFKYAKRYCHLLPDKCKPNKTYPKPLDSPCVEPLCIDLEDCNDEGKCADVENTYAIDNNVTNERFGVKYDVIQSIDKVYLKNILQTIFKETETRNNITVCDTGKYVNDNLHISNKGIFLGKVDTDQNKCTMRDVGIQSILHNSDYMSQNIGSPLCNPIENGEVLVPSSGMYQNDFPETISAKPKSVPNFVEETSDELDNASYSHIYELCEAQTDLIPLFKLHDKEMDYYNKIMEIKIESPGIKMLKKRQIEKMSSLRTAIHNIIMQDPCFHEVLKKAQCRR